MIQKCEITGCKNAAYTSDKGYCDDHQRERAEAAEARAAALEAERDALNARCETLQTMYRSDHDQRIAQEEQIKQLESEIEYLRSTDHAADTDDETPLGKALDGLGDEVEP